jgi:hypothetical protein
MLVWLLHDEVVDGLRELHVGATCLVASDRGNENVISPVEFPSPIL